MNIKYCFLQDPSSWIHEHHNFTDPIDQMILYELNEEHDLDLTSTLIGFYFDLIKNRGFHDVPVKILLNTSAINAELPNFPATIYKINWFGLVTYYRTLNADKNSSWNPDSGKALFLMGKPYNYHRAPFLYHLTRLKSWEKIVYSFPAPPSGSDVEHKTRRLFDEMNVDYDEFVNEFACNLDLANNKVFTDDGISYHYTGFPYDVSLFKNTSVSIVSETNTNWHLNNQHACLTEKTWKPIVNRQPFIFYGQLDGLIYLKSIGYHTFDYLYAYHPDYMRKDTPNQEKNALHAYNVDYFLENYYGHRDRIAQETEENYETFVSMNQATIQEIWDGDMNEFNNFMNRTPYRNLS
jgi:hypothetical protein